MRAFEDCESGRMVYDEDLRREFEQLREIDPETYDYPFERYVDNCTGKNGTLRVVDIGVGKHSTMWNVNAGKAWLNDRGIRFDCVPDANFMFWEFTVYCTEELFDEFCAYMKSL